MKHSMKYMSHSKKGHEVKHQKCPFQVSWLMPMWIVMVTREKMENREDIGEDIVILGPI